MSRLFGTTSILSLSTALISLPVNASSDHRENILGTSFDMTIHGAQEGQSQQIFDAVIAEIKRLERHFSPKKPDSELSVINQNATGHALSQDMVSLLKSCENWRTKTNNAVSCRIGNLQDKWRLASQTDQLPDKSYMKELAQSALEGGLGIEGTEISRAFSLDPTGLAKGYILDKALDTARSLSPTATGIKIDIGGDAVYWGTPSDKENWTVGVADPHNPQDNGGFLAALALRSKAIASSGHTSRMLKVADKNYSQIINPRTGWMMEDAPAATVVANDALTADALATALSTMPIKEGLQLINGMADVEALIVAPDQRRFPSTGWYALQVDTGFAHETTWHDGFSFQMAFTIPEATEGNYKRPYVGIWVTTPQKELVKSLTLLGESRRWMEENYVFWRRYGRKFDSIVDGITRPTRMPGTYNITWDGRDDFGNAIEAGDYILHVEMSREHGDHTYKKLPITIGAKAFTLAQDPEGEIGSLNVQFDNTNSGRQG